MENDGFESEFHGPWQDSKSRAEHGTKMRMGSLGTWPRGVTASTLDSESSDRGSNPHEAFLECNAAFRELCIDCYMI